jgi:hypothetical protein
MIKEIEYWNNIKKAEPTSICCFSLFACEWILQGRSLKRFSANNSRQ